MADHEWILRPGINARIAATHCVSTRTDLAASTTLKSAVGSPYYALTGHTRRVHYPTSLTNGLPAMAQHLRRP